MTICLVLTMACGAVSIGLTSRRLGLPAITTTLGVFQLGLHYCLMWLASAGCAAGSPVGVAPMRMQSGPAQMLTCAPMVAGAMASTAHVSAAHVSAGLMLGAHAVATMATAWVLAHGERVLWLLVSAVWTVFHTVGTVLITPAKRRPKPPLTDGVGRALVALGGIGQRGPPPPRQFA
jgi:hypothetical protein